MSRYQRVAVQTAMSSVVLAAWSPAGVPDWFTELPHAVNVTVPLTAAPGVQNTVNVAGSPTFGAECVASDQPLVPAGSTRVDSEFGPPTANVPCWLDRRLKPAAPGVPLIAATVNVSVIGVPGTSRFELAVRLTIPVGAVPPL